MDKKCSGCGEEKLFDKFYKDKWRADGYKNWCKSCAKEYQQSLAGKVVQK